MLLPGFIKKLLAVCRGSVAPPLILLSVLLGFWTGMMPGWSGLHTLLAVVVLVMNVHVGLFLLSLGLGKGLSLAAAPVLYHVGLWVQGHLGGLLEVLASIPIIGMTDFSRFALVGGLVIGPVIGAVAGLVLAMAVINFRRMMVKLDEKSEKFRLYYSKFWVRLLDRFLIGKRARDVKSMFAKAKYVRKAGVAVAVVLVGGFLLVSHLLQDTAVREYAVKTLTNANKAEANIGSLGISVLGGNVSVSGLQLTDPEQPTQNQLAVQTISADANIYQLLLGRLVLEKMELSKTRFNEARETPGTVLEVPTEEKPFDPNTYEVDANDVGQLEKYIKDVKKLKEQLAKLRNWLPDSNQAPVEAEQQAPHKYLEYLDAKANTPPSPRMLAKLLLADNAEIPSKLFGNSRVEMTNLSDAPAAAGLPIVMQIKSHVTPALLKVVMDYSQSDTPEVSGTFEGFDLSQVQEGLSQDAGIAFQSGLAGGTFTGTLTKEQVDLTFNVSLKDLQAQGTGKGVLGLGAEETSQVMQALKELTTTIRVVGPVTEPRLVFDTKGLTKEFKTALVNAGKQRLQQEVDKQLQEQLGDKVPADVQDKLKAPAKDLVEGLGGLLGGKKKEE